MARMIADIVDFARIRQGMDLPLSRTLVNLTELCAVVLDELRLTNPTRSIELESLGGCEGCWDRDRMAQVISNLVVNALKHGAADTVITVRVGGDEAQGFLEVHNFGGLIAGGAIDRIFEPFTTAADASTDSLGLGLYIVREVVKAHGGAVEVTSSAAAGTTFRVSLPKRPA
jgi:signal transduction histidine kinase